MIRGGGGDIIINPVDNETAIYAIANAQVQLRYNNNTKLETKTDGVNITGELECDTLDVDGDVDFDGGQVTFSASNNTLDFADDAKAQFGDGDDLILRHNGSASYIENSTGFLFIHGNDIALRSQAQENYIVCDANAEVELYFDNAKKFETKAYGVDVTLSLIHI